MNLGACLRYRRALAVRKGAANSLWAVPKGLAVRPSGGPAPVNGLHQHFGAGRHHLPAVVDIHHVVIEADDDEEGTRQDAGEIPERKAALITLEDDGVWAQPPQLFAAIRKEGVEASDFQGLVVLQELGDAHPEERVGINNGDSARTLSLHAGHLLGQ